jgi:hypothetical protein
MIRFALHSNLRPLIDRQSKGKANKLWCAFLQFSAVMLSGGLRKLPMAC